MGGQWRLRTSIWGFKNEVLRVSHFPNCPKLRTSTAPNLHFFKEAGSKVPGPLSRGAAAMSAYHLPTMSTISRSTSCHLLRRHCPSSRPQGCPCSHRSLHPCPPPCTGEPWAILQPPACLPPWSGPLPLLRCHVTLSYKKEVFIGNTSRKRYFFGAVTE